MIGLARLSYNNTCHKHIEGVKGLEDMVWGLLAGGSTSEPYGDEGRSAGAFVRSLMCPAQPWVILTLSSR